MNKKILGILALGMVCLSACADDAPPGVTILDPCSEEGATKCSQAGRLMICEGGYYRTEACADGYRCYENTCRQICQPETYGIGCNGEEARLYCNADGIVVSEACIDDNICHQGKCRDKSLEKCDTSYTQKCRGESAYLTCSEGYLVNHYCAENTICNEGICEEVVKCDAASFTPKCVNDVVVKVCKDGIEKPQGCPEGQMCLNGTCSTACTDDFHHCSEDQTKEFVCKDGQVDTLFCAADQICKKTGCGNIVRCDPKDFVPECTGDNTRTVCAADSHLVTEIDCPSDQICYKGSCVSDTRCDSSAFTPKCVGTTSVKVCKESGNGFASVEECKNGETCENGVCQTLADSCTTESATCVNGNIKRECIEGKWHEAYCNVGTEVCLSGSCVDVSTAVSCSESFKASCEDNVKLVCEHGYVAKYDCGEGKHCSDGKCFDDIHVGDPCVVDTFEDQCLDTDKLLICADGVVTEVPCGNKTCVAGACSDEACIESSFTSECKSETSHTVCKNSKIEEESCKEGEHCDGGVCKKDAQEGDPCTEESFVTSCTSTGKLAECKDSKIVWSTCADENHVCLSGACVACDPNNKEAVCAGDKAIKVCNATGSYEETACTGDDVCYQGKCTECDPSKNTKVCGSESVQKVCNAEGKFEQHTCPDGFKCVEGECTNNCTTNDDCKVEHYTCQEGKCQFQPECAVTDPKTCSADGKSVKSCQSNGLFTETACLPNEICKNGACMGNECDPESYGTQCKDDNKTRLYCDNGYIKTNKVCAGVCKDGECVDCIYGETASSCKGEVNVECTPENKYNEYRCDTNFTCKPGKGCVSKCGDDFVDHCEGNKRVYCNGASAITEECDFRHDCTAGKCEPRAGKDCVPVLFENTCFDNGGSPVLEYCNAETGKISFNSCVDDNFCGKLHGVTNCYSTCTQEDVTKGTTWCVTWWDARQYIGKCTTGTDYKGNSAIGIYRNASICDKGNSVSCRADTLEGHNKHIVFDYKNCSYMNSGAACTTGSCGFASCTSASATCSGNVATNCMYDPAYNNGLGGLVSTSMNCATVGGTCVKYNPDGVERAVCNVSFTGKYDGVERTVSSLGTCVGNTLYTLYWSSENDHAVHTKVCQNNCNTVNAGSYSYAYCN